MPETDRILVFGASSQIGDALLPALRAAGERVYAVSRMPRLQGEGVHWLQGDFHAQLPLCERVLSLGPLPPFADWLARQPAHLPRRIIAVSSLSLRHKRHAPARHERRLAGLLAAAEAALQTLACERSLQLTLLRPALLYGRGRDHTVARAIEQARVRHWLPLPLPAAGLRQPLHLDDLAQALLQCVQGAAIGQTLELGGGEVLSLAALLRRIAATVPGCRLLPLPAWPLRQVAGLLGHWSPSAAALAGTLLRANQDQLADETLTRRLLDWQPRPFEPA